MPVCWALRQQGSRWSSWVLTDPVLSVDTGSYPAPPLLSTPPRARVLGSRGWARGGLLPCRTNSPCTHQSRDGGAEVGAMSLELWGRVGLENAGASTELAGSL